jgi:hypothetical protein
LAASIYEKGGNDTIFVFQRIGGLPAIVVEGFYDMRGIAVLVVFRQQKPKM